MLACPALPRAQQQAVELLAAAQRLGLNTLRFFAFVDGAGRAGALQVAPGVLDEASMRWVGT